MRRLIGMGICLTIIGLGIALYVKEIPNRLFGSIFIVIFCSAGSIGLFDFITNGRTLVGPFLTNKEGKLHIGFHLCKR